MITDIFKEKIADQRLIEQEEAEKKKKKKEELAAVLKKAEKDIENLLEKAPPSSFKIPEGAACAVVVQSISNDESKGSFVKKYSVFTGYKKSYIAGPEDVYKKLDNIGEIELHFEGVEHSVDFSNMFSDDATIHKEHSETGTLFFFIFKDSTAE